MTDIKNLFKEVARKASIVDVISYELGPKALVKSGKDYKCLCPFHNDHSPSMIVNVSKNIFKCYVDGNGGDPIRFVELYEKIKPMEALKKVCQICHLPLPESLSNFKERIPQIELQFQKELDALKELNRFYQTYLFSKEGKECLDYLAKRKIPQSAIEHFKLGFAPYDAQKAIDALRSQGYEVDTLEKAGILSNSSEIKDRFSCRLMYPIEDDFGHLVGFSGRKIREEQTGGKYINYPETPLFKKSNILYHYAQAKKVAKKYGYIYVVEGFNDVIAFVRAGIESVVGSMGTALTKENIQSLKRLEVEVRLCLDKDEPGQLAEEECLPLLLEAGVPFRVVRPFKGGKDADEVLANFNEEGNEELNREASRLYDPFLFLLARALKNNGDKNKLTDSFAISQFIDKAKPFFHSLNAVSQIQDLNSLSKVTSLDISSLKVLLGTETNEYNPNPPKAEEEKKKSYPTSSQRQYYSKRFNKDYRRQLEIPLNLINQNNLPSNFKLAEDISGFLSLALLSQEGQRLNDKLVKNETQIIYVLPHSREAYMSFQEAHFDILFKPFHALALMCDIIYSQNHEKIAFFYEDYLNLKEHLSVYEEQHKAFLERKNSSQAADLAFDVSDVDLSDFDMEDIETDQQTKDPLSAIYEIEISKEDVLFLLKAIDFISRAEDNIYKKDTFDKELAIHPLLSKYNEREIYCKLNGIDPSLDSELLKLKVEIKRKGF